jgi:hypothetical protein
MIGTLLKTLGIIDCFFSAIMPIILILINNLHKSLGDSNDMKSKPCKRPLFDAFYLNSGLKKPLWLKSGSVVIYNAD